MKDIALKISKSIHVTTETSTTQLWLVTKQQTTDPNQAVYKNVLTATPSMVFKPLTADTINSPSTVLSIEPTAQYNLTDIGAMPYSPG